MLAKVVGTLLGPLGLFFGLAALAGVLRLARRARAARVLLALAVALLWAASTPVVAGWSYWQLARHHLPTPVASLPDADVAILLGGATEPPIPPRLAVDLLDTADRIVYAADLYHAGKAPRILLSGGGIGREIEGLSEAESGAEVLAKLGVPRSALILETRSRTTAENAAEVARIFREQGLRSGLLVTSAGHMRRSLAAFRAAGVPVVPASTDLEAVPPFSRDIRDWLPQGDALRLSSDVVWELWGYLFYRARGIG